ncbi:Aste57867_22685 [Aphanomyces stellatus]|uniref:Aste57867_22685 protein n=1 Tax=Aphanomyces stellatus TaxID=120398 RepID=A0A485LLB4_9STRA|nr:hypothetical protein As57867_022615 [Aphanomyces stellatus]VFT99339.1 Aste57867_22685 [Aphanomyces stellatus]
MQLPLLVFFVVLACSIAEESPIMACAAIDGQAKCRHAEQRAADIGRAKGTNASNATSTNATVTVPNATTAIVSTTTNAPVTTSHVPVTTTAVVTTAAVTTTSPVTTVAVTTTTKAPAPSSAILATVACSTVVLLALWAFAVAE